MDRAQIFFGKASEGIKGLQAGKGQCSRKADLKVRIDLFFMTPEVELEPT